MSITAFTARRARTLRLAAAGLTAVAALTLTACNNNEGTGTESEGKPDSSEQEIGPCDINKLTIGVKSVQRPVNYMVLEVNNHAGVDCNMPGYPILKFGEDAQAATPVYEDSKPQAVVTLAPGKTAYAGIRTSSADGSGQNGYKATSLEVFLQGSDDSKSVELPGGSVYIDDTAQVTYWQSDLANALD
ncbi:DUF4232 domain-containing protein [Streptomyces milbemycinicus]|uniref:DUF4232 domain-containing protein n=1 Tax=Streptomyces milbemycinicus TaxID=476552 RepID=UPI000A37720C|nr:DUF4232 domain-containing protein [Streptomyces milbemycinicus]